MKRAILILSILAIVLVAVGFFGFAGAAASAAANCTQTASGQAQCATGSTGGILGGAAVGSLGLLVGALLAFVSWLLGLIKTAQIKRWGWFVAIFFLTPLSSLLYGIMGPTE